MLVCFDLFSAQGRWKVVGVFIIKDEKAPFLF